MDESISLSEEDIPGAKIPRETVQQCTVVQLKRWLSCRGANTSGVKAILINRVKDYIKSGLDVKYLKDPDGGVNVLKKAAQLGVLEKTEPELSESFPKDGFSCDLSNIPEVTFGTIWRYMIECVEIKKQLSTAKPLVKGYNFFKSGHVLFIGHLAQADKHYLKSQVLPSMKKKSVYTCHIVITSAGNLLSSQCGCPAGVDGRCNHVTATLFAAAEYCEQRPHSQPTSSTEKLSCTSQPCKWNVPRERKGNVTPIGNMTFSKHDYSKTKKIRKSAVPPGHDVRAPYQRTWPQGKVNKMLCLVQDYQEKSGKVVGWSHILPQNVEQSCHDEDIILNASINVDLITAEKENYVSLYPVNVRCEPGRRKLTFDEDCINNDDGILSNSNEDLITPEKEHPISSTTIKERCERVQKKLKLDKDEISEVEKATRGQANNLVWYNQRKYRITASKCYRIASMKPETSPSKAIKEVLQYNPLYQSKSMKEGIEMESKILEDYEVLMHQNGNTELRVSQCGFFVSEKEGFLGASPDALVEDPSLSDPKGLVEIKYIQMNEDETLSDALVRKLICSRSNVELKTSHQYYYQIQQQMYVTKRKWTDFVVKGSKSNEIYCKRVIFSDDFWSTVLPKLALFCERWLLPEIAYPKVKFGLPKLDLRSL